MTEVFQVTACVPYRPSCVHALKSLTDEVIEGKFYGKELSLCVKPKDSDIYRIEKILKKKKRGKELFYLVKWLDFPKKQASWIKASDIVST
jgi:hypothetical protein